MNVKNRKKAILLVEDDDADSEIVEILLKRNNISNPLYRARDGIEALEILQKMADDEKLDQPFLLLVDIYMPRMSGLKFLENVRRDEALKNNVAVILTTSSYMDDRARAYSLNVAGYVLKDQMHELTGFIDHCCTVKALAGKTTAIFNERACFAPAPA